MPFPSGAASVNRILSYSKGLVELGNEVIVYSTSKGNDIEVHTINGIKYRALRINSDLKIIRLFSLYIALFRLVGILLFTKKKIDVIITVSNSLLLIYPLFIISKIKKINFVQEKSEFPFVLGNRSILGKICSWFYVNTTYKLFDGMIIMTYKLEEYFKDKIRKDCKTIVVPMTVEPERFKVNEPNELGDYIAYCGDIGGNKDGVQNLITAFSYIYEDFPELKLLLIGGSKNPNERIKLEEYVDQLKCQNIIFYGTVSRDQIPSLLCNAKILALARPSSLQSSGGFPTKLGEYLSTSNPTIVTKVGDIPLYLENRISAFLVEPDNNIEFAENLKYILNNYEEAKEIAKNGKNLVYETFNYLNQAKNLHKFFKNEFILNNN